MKSSIIFVTGCISVLLCGCGQNADSSLWSTITELGREKTELKAQVEGLEQENKTLTEQVETLSAVDKYLREEAISTLERIVISKRTKLFDKDEDGIFETLVVIIVPFDDAGDKVKAAGEVEVQLWDLDVLPDDARLAKWTVEAEEMKTRWMGMMLTDYYRLEFDVAGLIKEDAKELTVKVVFTEYIKGKIFRARHVVKL
jgi:hypothetical protein